MFRWAVAAAEAAPRSRRAPGVDQKPPGRRLQAGPGAEARGEEAFSPLRSPSRSEPRLRRQLRGDPPRSTPRPAVRTPAAPCAPHPASPAGGRPRRGQPPAATHLARSGNHFSEGKNQGRIGGWVLGGWRRGVAGRARSRLAGIRAPRGGAAAPREGGGGGAQRVGVHQPGLPTHAAPRGGGGGGGGGGGARPAPAQSPAAAEWPLASPQDPPPPLRKAALRARRARLSSSTGPAPSSAAAGAAAAGGVQPGVGSGDTVSQTAELKGLRPAPGRVPVCTG